jgi:TPR repeat protein
MMKKPRDRRSAGRIWLGIALISLVVPFALAGPEQDTELAEKEFARGDLAVSMALWRKAAQQGYAPAQVRLGDILDKAEEDEEAVTWYRKAAEQGSAAGEYGLGQMYAKGEGVQKDFDQARLFILRSAEKNYLPAVTLMMEAYRAGSLGVNRDLVQARQWESKVQALSPRTEAAAVTDAKKTKTGDVK